MAKAGWKRIAALGFLILLAVLLVAVALLIRLNPGLPLNALGMGLAIDQVELPPGFSISVYSSDVEGARSLAVGTEGTVFVGSRDAGNVYALEDRDGDGRAEEPLLLAEGLDSPNGVAFHEGDLYVAEISRVLRFPGIEGRLSDPPAPEVVRDDFPTEGLHGWKFIGFGPEGHLYVPVGAPCNACEPPEPRFAAITRMLPDGSDFEIFAEGVRNTVGFDWHPETGELWFTDNGRDWLGDDLPPDELNRAPGGGLHFGFPYVYGENVPDPDFGEGVDTSAFVPPVQELGPHVAALGMRFYNGEMFPAEYRGDIFIAEHGSWNRTVPIGYRIVRVPLVAGDPEGYEVFASGWLDGRRAWGRPVDVQVMPDGSLLVSDDRAGAIYRIIYAE